jgi:hypothetical protein
VTRPQGQAPRGNSHGNSVAGCETLAIWEFRCLSPNCLSFSGGAELVSGEPKDGPKRKSSKSLQFGLQFGKKPE